MDLFAASGPRIKVGPDLQFSVGFVIRSIKELYTYPPAQNPPFANDLITSHKEKRNLDPVENSNPTVSKTEIYCTAGKLIR